MKFLLVFIVFISSCKKEELTFKFLSHAELNGVPWEGGAGASDIPGTDRIAFNFSVANADNILRESIEFGHIPKEIGRYDYDFISTDSLFSALYATISDDGDVIKDLYHLDKSKLSNYISIDKLTEIEIEGEFDLTFTIDTTRIKIDVNAPDTIHFTNGTFLATVIE